jgi:phosphoribosylaminoimidazole carboxylase PurE protein
MTVKESRHPRVGIVLGSENDLPLLEKGVELLKRFGVEFEVELSSAHRAPQKTARYAQEAEDRGIQVLTAHTPLPVIGIPLDTSPLKGIDSVLSTVQMPAGVPVATVTIGPAGAVNAAMLALQILGTSDPAIRNAVRQYKKELAEKVAKRAEEIRKHS